MEIQTEKPVLLEWKFANCPDPVRTVYMVPLGGGMLLEDVGSDAFESVTITSGERVQFLSLDEPSV